MSRKNNNVRYEEAYARVQAGEKVTRVLREMRLPVSAYYLWLRRGGGNGQVKHYRANGATEEQTFTFTPPGLQAPIRVTFTSNMDISPFFSKMFS